MWPQNPTCPGSAARLRRKRSENAYAAPPHSPPLEKASLILQPSSPSTLAPRQSRVIQQRVTVAKNVALKTKTTSRPFV